MDKTLVDLYQKFKNNKMHNLFIKIRQYRAEELRMALLQPEIVTLQWFNENVWNIGFLILDGQKVDVFSLQETDDALIQSVLYEIENRTLDYQGNSIWGSGSRVFDPNPSRTNDEKLENVRRAIRVLADEELSYQQRIAEMIKIPGLGYNTATGLMMAFYPRQFAIYNSESRKALASLGYIEKNLEQFQDKMAKLKAELNAQDYIELDWFLYNLNKNADADQVKSNYWIFQGNPAHFDVINALRSDKIRTWRVTAHKNKILKGDKVIIWVTGPQSGCYALATVTSEVYLSTEEDEDEKEFELIDKGQDDIDVCVLQFDLIFTENPILKAEIRENEVLKNLKAGFQGTNFQASREEYEEILKIAKTRLAHPSTIVPIQNPRYSLAELAEDIGLILLEAERWLRAVERKGQCVLYGPPGTGKTYAAERIARHLISESDGFYDLVQFHPAYSYEDFMQGIRPKTRVDGGLEYPLVPGRFLDFCDKAKKKNGLCVLIVDEINRANLARVFGELMYLLEYRNKTIPLAGGGRFAIPDNVRIIGTMNTADRSIALVDHALRRRFAFLSLRPNYEILRRYHEDSDINIGEIVKVLQDINKQIADPHYEVGISFFMRPDLRDQLEDIWRMEIEPYLEEFFFDHTDMVDKFRWIEVTRKLHG